MYSYTKSGAAKWFPLTAEPHGAAADEEGLDVSALQRFTGKIALISGASTGIGLATAARLMAEGAVVYAGRRSTGSDRLLGAAIPLHLDVTSEEDWRKAVDTVLKRHGKLDVLVNNAGVRESNSIEETSLEQWHRLIDVNLTSTFLGCRAVVPALRDAGGGAIVNVGSITGIRGTENMVAYSASKGGIVSMTSSLALDLAVDNLRVNSIFPAAVRTRMVTSWLESAPDSEAAEAAVLAKHPIGRIGRPEEVAGAIAFLASEDAAFMTGLSVPIDGGRSIR